MGLDNRLNEDVMVEDGRDVVVVGGKGNKSFGGSPVSCSICLEVVADSGDRSWAKLQCGHQFHLDCIGSAFNMKGVMQCPNCRKIEKGQWLYANGGQSVPELNMDDWANDEDIYDLSYSEMSLGVGVHWCPFSSMTRIHPTYEERDFSSNAWPVHHPSSSSSGGSFSDGSSFNSYWSSTSIPSEHPSSYAFPGMDLHYHSWEHHSPPFSTTSSLMAPADQPSAPSTQRPASGSSDILSFLYPFSFGHSPSEPSSTSLPYQGSNARTRDRVQALQAYYQPGSSPTGRAPMTPGTRRPNSHRGSSQAGTMASSSDQSSFYLRNFQEPETQSRFVARERDHPPSFPMNQGERNAGWDPSIRSSSLRQWQGSERMP